MITNAHILTIDACLGDMRSIVRNMDESPEKQELTELISHLTHEMFAINTDLTHSQHELTELRRQIYEPFVRAQAGTVCRRIMALETQGYILLSNVKDDRKAELINLFSMPKYNLHGDDFRKARNG